MCKINKLPYFYEYKLKYDNKSNLITNFGSKIINSSKKPQI